jgi:peptidoglycan/xylan/chitin deacetylase (PgdA/CDA1 family)
MTIIDRHSSIFAISLDFELFWGVRDRTTLASYGQNIMGVRRAIPRLLELFAKYDIHSTWATVGFLFFDTKAQLLADLPQTLPTYQDQKLNPYDYFDKIGEGEQVDPYHYAPTLIRQIQTYPHQEIASHTFSHYDCGDEGQTIAQFESDLIAAIDVAGRYGIEIDTLVFPGHRIDPKYLKICRERGISSYRTSHHRHAYANNRCNWRRCFHCLDSYLPLSGSNIHQIYKRDRNSTPIELPASRYLRPYNPKYDWLEALRFRRIAKDMTTAAKRGGLYHLCWRPHDFGLHMKQNIMFLEQILRHYAKLQEQYGMYSLNMGEIANLTSDRQPVAFPVYDRTRSRS